MKAYPLLFNQELIAAILAGKKSQTRRVVKGSKLKRLDGEGQISLLAADPRSPYGTMGDQLWVREPYRFCAWDEDFESALIEYKDGTVKEILPGEIWTEDETEFVYDRLLTDCIKAGRKIGFEISKAPAEFTKEQIEKLDIPWQSPIFMPRRCSRLRLVNEGIRIERLQRITEVDAIAEGILHLDGFAAAARESSSSPQESFSLLWDRIHAAGSGNRWTDDPWVWVINFSVNKM
jgi:hypothetical protein